MHKPKKKNRSTNPHFNQMFQGEWKFACDLCGRKYYLEAKLNDHKKLDKKVCLENAPS